MQEDHATPRRSAPRSRGLFLTEDGERALAAFEAPIPYRVTVDHERGSPLESVPPLGMVS